MILMSLSHDGTLHLQTYFPLCFVGANDTFTFQATSLNPANTQVFKERTLTAIYDLDDRTFGQNSELQVNVLQCKHMVNTILASKCYLMEQTCTSSADPIYKELFCIVRKADLIVQECSDEPLKLKSLLAQMDNVHAFVDGLYEPPTSCTIDLLLSRFYQGFNSDGTHAHKS